MGIVSSIVRKEDGNLIVRCGTFQISAMGWSVVFTMRTVADESLTFSDNRYVLFKEVEGMEVRVCCVCFLFVQLFLWMDLKCKLGFSEYQRKGAEDCFRSRPLHCC